MSATALDAAVTRLAAVINSRGELGAQPADLTLVCGALYDLRQVTDFDRLASDVVKLGAYGAAVREVSYARERVVHIGRFAREERRLRVAAERERDDALAKLEAIRSVRSQHPACDVVPEGVSCGWKPAVLDIDSVLREAST